MARFHLALIRPPEYVHSSCFHEVIEGVYLGLARLGHKVTGGENNIEPAAINIVFGAHLLEESVAMSLPPSTVIYNLEQIGVLSQPAWYMRLAEFYQVWDYTEANLAKWRAMPFISPPQLVEVAFMPQLARISAHSAQDIDVLFYGSVNDRRRELLDQVRNSGISIHCLYGVYGPERDDMIARARIVLNLHQHPMELFEIVRVSYLLANSKAVVTENSPDIGRLAHAVAICKRNEIARTCRELLEDEGRRRQLEYRGYLMFSATSLMDTLSLAVRKLV